MPEIQIKITKKQLIIIIPAAFLYILPWYLLLGKHIIIPTIFVPSEIKPPKEIKASFESPLERIFVDRYRNVGLFKASNQVNFRIVDSTKAGDPIITNFCDYDDKNKKVVVYICQSMTGNVYRITWKSKEPNSLQVNTSKNGKLESKHDYEYYPGE